MLNQYAFPFPLSISKMRRHGMAIAIAIVGLAAFIQSESVMATDIKERNLKFAFVQPLDSNQGVGAQRFSELVSQKSGGKISVKLFPNGTLGGEVAVVSSLQGGVIDFSMIAPALLVGQLKEQAIWDTPFLFSNYKEVDAIFDGPIGRKLSSRLPEKGLVSLAYGDHGFRNVANSKRSISKLEDIDGLKIRVPQSPLYIDTFRALGANPTPLPFPEVYSALENKTVDGVEQPNGSILASRFSEVSKYLTVTRHIYTPIFFLMSKKTLDQMSGDEKKIIQDAANETALFQREASRAMDQKALATLKANGMIVNEMSNDELTRLRIKLQPVMVKYVKEIGEPLVNEMNAELQKIRAKN